MHDIDGKCNRVNDFVGPLQDDPIGNLNTAFEVAEKYLDIPKMLDAEGERKIASEINPVHQEEIL